MVTVYIPASLRQITSGDQTVTLNSETVREVIEGLDQLYPGNSGSSLPGRSTEAWNRCGH